MIKIRNAERTDAEQIQKLISSLNIIRDSKEKSGFVEYPQEPLESLKSRISQSPMFYVAENNQGIIGLCSNFTEDMLVQRKGKGEIERYLLCNFSNFVYMELVGVERTHQGRTIGKRLFERTISDSKEAGFQRIVGTIVHAPYRNEVSIRMGHHFGLEEVGEVRDTNGLTFGIYEKEL